MITKWKVSNFKSIREETELEFGPLTIFAGANSSGKSTFIQSILLVAQSLSHKVGSRSVVLNGALTSLGQFDDLKSNDTLSEQIDIKCTCCPLMDANILVGRPTQLNPRNTIFFGPRIRRIQEISASISFDADSSSIERDLFQIQPRLFSTQLSCISRDEDNIDTTAEVSIQKSSLALSGIEGVDELSDQLRSGLTYRVSLDTNSLLEAKDEYRSATPVGTVLRHFLPDRIIYSINTIEEDANAITNALQEDDRRTNNFRRSLNRELHLSPQIIEEIRKILHGVIDLDHTLLRRLQQQNLFGPEPGWLSFRSWHESLRELTIEDRKKVQKALRDCDDLFSRIHSAMKSTYQGTHEPTAFVHSRPPRQIMEATRYLEDFFASSLKYLGPLRDAPKPLYPLAPAADPNDVGLRGEHTASILDLHKGKKIRYIPSTSFKDAQIDHKIVIRTLETGVVDWLHYLGVASSIRSKDKGKLGHELKVILSDSAQPHDLTHVGVGVSQVLPILVMCLLAEPDSTLIFEQPELHLHPKVQTLLGDFFLSMALCGKQCIVETHSEYFIDRLRFRIAAAPPEKELNSQAKIYFVEKPTQASAFREVVINEYGAILDWPAGFFDQSHKEAEAILTAALAKKRSKKNRD